MTDLADLLHDGITTTVRDGILTDDRWEPVGVTDQFLGDADTYHARYFARSNFLGVVSRLLGLAGVQDVDGMTVLDIGSGSGSSVFPLCTLLPRARVIATDISPPLLGMLRRIADADSDLTNKPEVFCHDLHLPTFRDEVFDLVVGTAILHHLLDPHAALVNAMASLRPGGRIVLVEPLEAGSLMQSVLHERVLILLDDLGTPDHPLAKLMEAQRLDTRARLGPPAPKPWTPHLDDKWVFDVPYLRRLGRELGASHVDVHPGPSDTSHVISGVFRGTLSDAGFPLDDVPPEVWELAREIENGISPELRPMFSPTGIIVLTK